MKMDITKPYFGSDKIRKEVREEFIRRHPDINPDNYNTLKKRKTLHEMK